MSNFKSTKGITLVALVVTIIVLIILAGVSIGLILGQDGIVQKAKQGRDSYAEAARAENEQLANVDAFALTIGDPETKEPEEPVDTNKYIKLSDGTEEVIGGDESLKAKYGQTVHTDFFSSVSETGLHWQLFYDDANYVFLIASDYVPNSTLTTGTGNLITKSGVNSTYNAAFCTDSNYNDGVLSSTVSIAPVANNKLTSTYLTWSGINTSTYNNMKAVSYMMDVSKWNQYAGSMYSSAQAIGGPTLELFIAS